MITTNQSTNPLPESTLQPTLSLHYPQPSNHPPRNHLLSLIQTNNSKLIINTRSALIPSRGQTHVYRSLLLCCLTKRIRNGSHKPGNQIANNLHISLQFVLSFPFPHPHPTRSCFVIIIRFTRSPIFVTRIFTTDTNSTTLIAIVNYPSHPIIIIHHAALPLRRYAPIMLFARIQHRLINLRRIRRRQQGIAWQRRTQQRRDRTD